MDFIATVYQIEDDSFASSLGVTLGAPSSPTVFVHGVPWCSSPPPPIRPSSSREIVIRKGLRHRA